MAAFPVFIELKDRRVLVVGGGSVAHRKIVTLSGFGPEITVVAPEIDSRIMDIAGVACIQSVYSKDRLAGMDMVIAATDDPELNRRIAGDCQELGILVNTASGRAENSFYFPAIARDDEYVIGISTNGKSPRASSEMRKKIESEILHIQVK